MHDVGNLFGGRQPALIAPIGNVLEGSAQVPQAERLPRNHRV
ncbi:MAG: hypothetical protein ACREVZ_16490 [Burkholderiales bacterium]